MGHRHTEGRWPQWPGPAEPLPTREQKPLPGPPDRSRVCAFEGLDSPLCVVVTLADGSRERLPPAQSDGAQARS